MDGTASLEGTPMPLVAAVVCNVRIERDSHGNVRDLVISGARGRAGEPDGYGDLVGRSLSEIVPGAAAELRDRLTDPQAGAIEMRAVGASPDEKRSLTARPGREADVWTVTIDPLPADPAVDARLKELNHRVLNSLAMLSSIIGIESRSLSDDAGRAALERVRSRLVAVSNLYRILSTSESGTHIRADIYLRSVADAVSASVGLGDRIAVKVDAAPCDLTTSQAASVGLITNEAMTNAYKHAFAGLKGGRIVVGLSESGSRLLLSVSDNGQGMSDNALSGLGTTLIEALAVDLAGEVAVASGAWGTSVEVRFPVAN